MSAFTRYRIMLPHTSAIWTMSAVSPQRLDWRVKGVLGFSLTCCCAVSVPESLGCVPYLQHERSSPFPPLPGLLFRRSLVKSEDVFLVQSTFRLLKVTGFAIFFSASVSHSRAVVLLWVSLDLILYS